MEFDLRFAEVGYEFMMLSEYANLLRSNLPTIIEAERKRVWDGLDPNEGALRAVAYHLEDRLDEGITTRFLTGALLIGSWAIYEATVQRMADYIRDAKKVSLKMSHLKGNFLQRARRYFDDVLKFDLHPLDTDWGRLERVADLRNVLAHANGRLPDVSEEDLRRIERWLRSTAGLTLVDDEYVVVSLEFAEEALKFIERLLDDVVERVRHSFK